MIILMSMFYLAFHTKKYEYWHYKLMKRSQRSATIKDRGTQTHEVELFVPFQIFRIMFWSDHGSNPHISSANMDGTNDGKIIVTDIQSPNGLAIDFSGKMILYA